MARHPAIRIVLLDDHSIFLNGMKLLVSSLIPKSEVVSFASIKEFKKTNISLETFDLFITDLELPGEDIFQFLQTLKQKSNIPTLVVSMHGKVHAINKCRQLGINGYLLKDDEVYFKQALDVVLSGGSFFSPRIIELERKAKESLIEFSLREEEILKLITEGASNQLIANKLFISVETVKTHKRNIRTKLGLRENHEIINYAKQHFI